jgi:hypothetical protein
METVRDLFVCVCIGAVLALAGSMFCCGTCNFSRPPTDRKEDVVRMLLAMGGLGAAGGLTVWVIRRRLRRPDRPRGFGTDLALPPSQARLRRPRRV